MDELDFRDNTAGHRFELLKDGVLAARVDYRLQGETLVFSHTEVDARHEGQGLGSKIAKLSLDNVRERGLKAVPRCEFIAAYIARHPEYQGLVAA